MVVRYALFGTLTVHLPPGAAMTLPKHILVVDRDGDVRQAIANLLLDVGHVVTLAKDAATMKAVLDANGVELIVLDASTSDIEAITLATVPASVDSGSS